MVKVLIGLLVLVVIAVLIMSWVFGIRNQMVTREESVNSSWAQVQNQYQRRFDLIPNLVETVKGYAAQEKDVLQGVTEARAKAGGVMNVSPEVLDDPQAFARFQEAQAGLGSALQRLLVVVEQYPELKSNQNFLTLQAQLEGTENRISVERRRFNEEVQAYNSYIRSFPQALLAGMFGFKTKSYFQAVPEAEQAPKVQF
ncbi:MAG: LemA family protein [Caldithrix sp. RBG_13_44_9]|nr:MAG: LemA family protein [Caldithrix sp. RBG_13_44_9]